MAKIKVKEPIYLPFTDKSKKKIISFPARVRFNGESRPGYFLHGKVYDVVGEENGLYRIIDESGEDYLYSLSDFEILREGE